MSSEDVEVINAMRRFGGGFVKALSEAASRADDQNLAKIKATWPEYWQKYRVMAEAAAKART